MEHRFSAFLVSILLNIGIFPLESHAQAPSCSETNVHCVGNGLEFSTIQAASNAALAGHVVLVFDGSHTGFHVANSGTQSSPVVFRANGSNVVINAGGTPENDGIYIGNKHYITIEGFKIRGVPGRCIAARQATATSPIFGLTIRNNICADAGKEGFYLSQVSNSLIEGNTVNRSGRLVALRGHGIYVANAGSDNTVLRGNTIVDSGVGGTDSAGIHFNGDASLGGDGLIKGLVIEKNTIAGGIQNGLNMDGVQDSIVQNNVIYGNARNALRAYRINASAGPRNLRIVNNTFVVPSSSTGWAIALSEDLGGHVVFNNILLAEGSGGSIRLESSSVSIISDRNRVANKFSVNGGSTVLTLAQWIASGPSRDVNSAVSIASALFVNAGTNDYRLAATSSAIDAGVAGLAGIFAPLTDRTNTSRPQGLGFDVGAYELSVADTAPPAISAVTSASITASGATISWTTDEAADSQVEYGTSTGYGSTTSNDPSFVTSHSQTISGLSPGTTYNYRVKSRDAAGNLAVSSNFTFITAYDSPPPGTLPPVYPGAAISYSVADGGAQSWTTTDTTAEPRTGYVRVQPESGTPSPAGVAIFGFRSAGVLVSEAGVPAAEPMRSGRVYVDATGFVKTGIAIANPAEQDTVISFYFTDNNGAGVGSGSFTLAARRQVAAFLDQPPFNGPSSMQGTFTFNSSVSSVSLIALRGLTNERGEFLMTTVPVAPLAGGFGGGVLTFPHYAAGGEWSTGVILINSTDTVLSGTIEFYNQGSKNKPAQPIRVMIGGSFATAFKYVIQPRAGFRIATERSTDATRAGSVRVTPDPNSPMPAGVAILSYKNAQGITVSETSIPALRAGPVIRVYAESSGTPGQVGSLVTGVAISNPSASGVTVQLDLRKADGTPTGFATTVEIPGKGQISRLINEFLPQMPATFQGVLTLTATAPVVVAGMRGRYNERADFLMTTIPASDAATVSNGSEVHFPHVLSGGGYTTQLTVFSADPGSVGAGKLSVVGQDGSVISLLAPK